VSLRAAVSQPLVSRSINRSTKVDRAKAERVFAALEQLFDEYAPIDTRAKVGVGTA